jgi:uncharacterized coiled-coil protein SlyX
MASDHSSLNSLQTYTLRKDALRAIKRRNLNPENYEIIGSNGQFKIIPKKLPDSLNDADAVVVELSPTPDIHELLNRLNHLETKLMVQEKMIDAYKAKYAQHKEDSIFRSHKYLHPTVTALSGHLRKLLIPREVQIGHKITVIPRERRTPIGSHWTTHAYGHQPGSVYGVYITEPIVLIFSVGKNKPIIVCSTKYSKAQKGSGGLPQPFKFECCIDTHAQLSSDKQTVEIIDAGEIIDLVVYQFNKEFGYEFKDLYWDDPFTSY